jgi:hypothetical protein
MKAFRIQSLPARQTIDPAETTTQLIGCQPCLRADRFISFVTRGLDPRVHPFREKMDCRVKPGNDAELGRSDRNPH